MTRKELVGGSYKPLSYEEIDRINETVLRVFEEIGCEINSEAALEALGNAGATVDRKERRVRFSRDRVLELIAQAPSEITLCRRDNKHDIHLGGTRVYMGTGGTALNIYEPSTGETHLTKLDDLNNIAGLVDKLNNIHLFLLPTYPSEVPIKRVDVNRFFAGLVTLCTQSEPVIGTSIDTSQDYPCILDSSIDEGSDVRTRSTITVTVKNATAPFDIHADFSGLTSDPDKYDVFPDYTSPDSISATDWDIPNEKTVRWTDITPPEYTGGDVVIVSFWVINTENNMHFFISLVFNRRNTNSWY